MWACLAVRSFKGICRKDARQAPGFRRSSVRQVPCSVWEIVPVPQRHVEPGPRCVLTRAHSPIVYHSPRVLVARVVVAITSSAATAVAVGQHFAISRNFFHGAPPGSDSHTIFICSSDCIVWCSSEDDGWGYLLPYPSSVLPEVSPEDGGASLLPNSSWPTPTYLPEASVGPPMFSTGFETTVSMEEAVVAMEVRHTYPVVTLSTHPSFRGSVLQLSP